MWQTDIPNACVVGLWPRHRFVYLTRGLLARLLADEVSAVHAHELAHVRSGHLWILLGWLGSWLLLLLAIDPLLGAPFGVARLAAYTAIGFAGMLGFTALSRHFEYESDSWAATQTSQASLVSTLYKVSDPGQDRSNSIWRRHPSSQRRVEMILKDGLAERTSQLGRRTRRLAGWVCGLAIILGGAFFTSTVTQNRAQLDRQIERASYLVTNADRRIFRRGEIGDPERQLLTRAISLFEDALVDLSPSDQQRRTAILEQLGVLYQALGREQDAVRAQALLDQLEGC